MVITTDSSDDEVFHKSKVYLNKNDESEIANIFNDIETKKEEKQEYYEDSQPKYIDKLLNRHNEKLEQKTKTKNNDLALKFTTSNYLNYKEKEKELNNLFFVGNKQEKNLNEIHESNLNNIEINKLLKENYSKNLEKYSNKFLTNKVEEIKLNENIINTIENTVTNLNEKNSTEEKRNLLKENYLQRKRDREANSNSEKII